MNRAPVFADAYRLCEWLLGRLESNGSVLAQRLSHKALDLLESVALALKDRRREERIDEADEILIVLRIDLRMAESTELLTESQVVFALAIADGIGRQLGGWRRSLGAL